MSSVDVVVPCYNYAHYLPFAVESALNQRNVDVRVLILNDQSPDNTAEAGARLAAQDPRVTYQLNEKNLGLIGTANKGIDWVTADYYVLLSADDALTPGALARAAEVLDKHKDVHLVYGRALVMGADNPAPIADVANVRSQVISGPDFLRRNIDFTNPVPSPTAIIRTDAQRRVGKYNPALPHTSDMEMWMRFAALGPVAVIRDAQAFYRVHNASMSESFNAQLLRDRREIIQTCSLVVDQLGDELPESREWLQGLKRRFADEAFWLAGKAWEAGDDVKMKARLEFAEANHPEAWRSRAAWQLRAKRALGRKLFRALRPDRGDGAHIAETGTEAGSYQAQAGEIGWWPEGH
jgi:glycosyltransferase involved in cell wall biosynthesis